MVLQRRAKIGRLWIEVERVLTVAFSRLAVTRDTVVRKQSFAVGLEAAEALFPRLPVENVHQRIAPQGARGATASGRDRKSRNEAQHDQSGATKPSRHGFLPERSVDSVMRYAVSALASSRFRP